MITGDLPSSQEDGVAPYQTMREINTFFGSIPGLDVTGVGGESRWKYVDEALRRVNGEAIMGRVVEEAVNPARFVRTNFAVEEAVDYLNDFLVYDGWRLRSAGNRYRIGPAEEGGLVPGNVDVGNWDSLSRDAILEKIEKAEARLGDKDFEGAITVARSLVETVLQELDARLPGEATDAKGDLLKLYKAVQRKLRLDPKDQDVESLRKILQGLAGIVDGLAGIRNRMSDAHPRKFKPHRHHAILAINAARTLTLFLLETQQYQKVLRTP